MKIKIVEEEGMQVLYCDGVAGLNPAGWRLQRGEPLPIKGFRFLALNEANEARDALQDYVDRYVLPRGIKRDKKRP